MSSTKSGSGADSLSLVEGNKPADTAVTGSGWGSAKPPRLAHVKWAVRHPLPFAMLLECILNQTELSHMKIWYVVCKVRQARVVVQG